MVYVLECYRLGIQLLPPCINDPEPGFNPRGDRIRVPVSAVKGLTERTASAVLAAYRTGRPFASIADFHERVGPSPEELESLIRAGACDGLGLPRPRHSQGGGECMQFVTLADRTGMVETELFANTYRLHGLAIVRYPVLEVTATVEPFEIGRGFTGPGNPGAGQTFKSRRGP